MSELLDFQSSQEGGREISDSKRVASPTLVIVEPPRAKPGGENEETAFKPGTVSFDVERCGSPQMQVVGELLLGELQPLPPVITFGDFSLLTPADGLLQRGNDELPFLGAEDESLQAQFDESSVTADSSHMPMTSPDTITSSLEGDAMARPDLIDNSGDNSVPLSPSPPALHEPEAEAEVFADIAIIAPLPELPQPEFLRNPSPESLPTPTAEVLALRSSSPSPLPADDVAEQGSRVASLHETSQELVELSQPPPAPLSQTVSVLPSLLAALPPIPSLPPPPPPPPPTTAQSPSATPSHSPSPVEEPDMPRLRYTQQPPQENDSNVIIVTSASSRPSQIDPTSPAESGTQPRSRPHPGTQALSPEASLPWPGQPDTHPSSSQRNPRPSRSMEVQPHQHPLATGPAQPTQIHARNPRPTSIQANEADPPPPSYDALNQTRPMPPRASSRLSAYAEPQEHSSVRSGYAAVPTVAQARTSQQVRSSASAQPVPMRQPYLQPGPIITNVSLQEDAPPDYNSLFGAPPSMGNTSARPSTRSPVPREEAIPMTRLGPRQPQAQPHPRHGRVDSDRGQDRSCFAYAKRSPEKSGIYIGLFIIGVLVSISMLAVGVIIFLTSSDEATQGIYLMVMGGACSFFVCWHSVALCTGVYIKSRNSDDKNYFILRVCNFGAFFLMIAAGVISFLIWTNLTEIVDNFTVLQGIVIGFLIIMYVMTLYCFVECFLDTCSILKLSFREQSAPVPAAYRRTAHP